jgi:hypothetical protein
MTEGQVCVCLGQCWHWTYDHWQLCTGGWIQWILGPPLISPLFFWLLFYYSLITHITKWHKYSRWFETFTHILKHKKQVINAQSKDTCILIQHEHTRHGSWMHIYISCPLFSKMIIMKTNQSILWSNYDATPAIEVMTIINIILRQK